MCGSTMSLVSSSLDLESEILIAQLAIKDLHDLKTLDKGKGRFDAPQTDSQMAVCEQLGSLLAHISLLEDIRLARSLDSALRLDGDVLERISVVEEAEKEDRQAALTLHRGQRLPAPSASQAFMEKPHDTLPVYVT